MTDFRIDASQLSKLAVNMAKIAKDLEHLYPDQLDGPLEKTVSTAQDKAPRGASGELSGKIRHGVHNRMPYVEAYSDHSAINEFGGTHPVFGGPARVRQEPRPFMRPAVEAHREDIKKAAIQSVREAARRAGYR